MNEILNNILGFLNTEENNKVTRSNPQNVRKYKIDGLNEKVLIKKDTVTLYKGNIGFLFDILDTVGIATNLSLSYAFNREDSKKTKLHDIKYICSLNTVDKHDLMPSFDNFSYDDLVEYVMNERLFEKFEYYSGFSLVKNTLNKLNVKYKQKNNVIELNLGLVSIVSVDNHLVFKYNSFEYMKVSVTEPILLEVIVLNILIHFLDEGKTAILEYKNTPLLESAKNINYALNQQECLEVENVLVEANSQYEISYSYVKI